MKENREKNNILYLSTFPPRECGIATFTFDLAKSMRKRFRPVIKPKIVAINQDFTDIYNYGQNVICHIAASKIEDYINIAKRINKKEEIKLIHIQHEFGIFGGDWGNHLIPFFQVIEKPVVVTFHSVLPAPQRHLKHTVQFIAKQAKAIIVMNELSKKMLEEDYGIKESKIYVIPHGIPQVSFASGKTEKQKLQLEGKIVLSTFGLLNRGKGIEYAIQALPKVIKQFPGLVYLVLGATHPVVRKTEGERYRNFLEKKVEKLGLKNNVRFYNKYLTLEEIVDYLKATDVYISPTLDQSQSVSGTLSYALGCGRPVISTDSLYAKNIVSSRKGILVEPRNPQAIARALMNLLQKPTLIKQMSRIAYTETRNMTWPNVALAHFGLYRKFIQLKQREKLPPVTLKHIKNLTDDFGIIQFAKHTSPDMRYGYCLDDNARAMIVAAQSWRYFKNKQAIGLLQTYLSFIEFVQNKNGDFANFVSKEKIVGKPNPSEDAQGRTIWALGFIAAENCLPYDIKNRAKKIFQKALPRVSLIKSPRAIAFAMLGLYLYGCSDPKSPQKKTFNNLAAVLEDNFNKTAAGDWLWFEDSLTYSNSKLPEALFCAYLATKEKKYLEIAEKSLNFLMDITFDKEYFSPIGQNGWYFRNEKRAYFDQQPEDASSMVQTLLLAHQITGKEIYIKRAHQAFRWFLGKNHLNQMVYDETTGGCYDGLGRYSLNINQGAESTISYLLARLDLENKKNKFPGASPSIMNI